MRNDITKACLSIYVSFNTKYFKCRFVKIPSHSHQMLPSSATGDSGLGSIWSLIGDSSLVNEPTNGSEVLVPPGPTKIPLSLEAESSLMSEKCFCVKRSTLLWRKASLTTNHWTPRFYEKCAGLLKSRGSQTILGGKKCKSSEQNLKMQLW